MITIEKYNDKLLHIWDDFISISSNGTIFHIHGVDINSSYKLKSYKKNSIGISVTSKNLDELIKSTILNQKN